MLNDYRWLVELLVGLGASAVGWFVGRRQKNNTFLGELQDSINALATKNAEQMNEILKLREQIVELRTENLTQTKELEQMRGENRELNEQVTALRKENLEFKEQITILTQQLSNIKSITRSK